MATATTSSTQWTHRQLSTKLLTDERTLITWWQKKNLLADEMTCSKCGSQCRLVQRRGSYSWRCPSKGCQCFKSIKDNSFFSRSHLKLDIIVELIYYWSKQERVTDAARKTGVSIRVAILWFNSFREVCAQYFLDHPITIGGPGKMVEINESKFGKRKYNHGRTYLLESLWRKRFQEQDLFEKLLECIAEQYPL